MNLEEAYQTLKQAISDPDYLKAWSEGFRSSINNQERIFNTTDLLRALFENDAPPPPSPGLLQQDLDNGHIWRTDLSITVDTLCERCGRKKTDLWVRQDNHPHGGVTGVSPCKGHISNLDRIRLEALMFPGTLKK